MNKKRIIIIVLILWCVIVVLLFARRLNGTTYETKIDIPDFLQNSEINFDLGISYSTSLAETKDLAPTLEKIKNQVIVSFDSAEENDSSMRQFKVIGAVRQATQAIHIGFYQGVVRKYLILEDENRVKSFISYGDTRYAFYIKNGQRKPIGMKLVFIDGGIPAHLRTYYWPEDYSGWFVPTEDHVYINEKTFVIESEHFSNVLRTGYIIETNSKKYPSTLIYAKVLKIEGKKITLELLDL